MFRYDFSPSDIPLPQPADPEFYQKVISCLGADTDLPRVKTFEDLVMLGKKNHDACLKSWKPKIADLNKQIKFYSECLQTYDQKIDQVLIAHTENSEFTPPSRYPETFVNCSRCKFCRERKRNSVLEGWCELCGPGIVNVYYKYNGCPVYSRRPRQKIEEKIAMLEQYRDFGMASVEILTKASMTAGPTEGVPMIPVLRPLMRYIGYSKTPAIIIVPLIGSDNSCEHIYDLPLIAVKCYAHCQKEKQHVVFCDPYFTEDDSRPSQSIILYEDSPFLFTRKDYYALRRNATYRALWMSGFDKDTAEIIESIFQRNHII